MTMNSSTPAILIRSKDLAKNVKAFAGCLELLPKTPKTVLDIRYGLGGWAKELRRRYPKVAITGYEADPSTYNTAPRGLYGPLPTKRAALSGSRETGLTAAG
jgi:trans-aconitate methyltransferase